MVASQQLTFIKSLIGNSINAFSCTEARTSAITPTVGISTPMSTKFRIANGVFPPISTKARMLAFTGVGTLATLSPAEDPSQPKFTEFFNSMGLLVLGESNYCNANKNQSKNRVRIWCCAKAPQNALAMRARIWCIPDRGTYIKAYNDQINDGTMIKSKRSLSNQLAVVARKGRASMFKNLLRTQMNHSLSNS